MQYDFCDAKGGSSMLWRCGGFVGDLMVSDILLNLPLSLCYLLTQ
jgi:hypothetical protein